MTILREIYFSYRPPLIQQAYTAIHSIHVILITIGMYTLKVPIYDPDVIQF